jgi:hypothetical protein
VEHLQPPTDRTAEIVPAVLEREMRMIREAIAVVASGASARVLLANLHFGEELLDRARRLADDAGLAVVPMFRAGEGADLSVERPEA